MQNNKSYILHPENNQAVSRVIEIFNKCYEKAGKPKNMAMYSHRDSSSSIIAATITPESVIHCTDLFEVFKSFKEFDVANPLGLKTFVAGDLNIFR